MGSRSIARLGVALAGTSAALLAFALPAIADMHPSADQLAHVDHKTDADGGNVWLEGGSDAVPTTLIGLRLDGSTDSVIRTYCVELTVNSLDGAQLKESPWEAYPTGDGQFTSDPKKVNWILHHSFPGESLKDLNDQRQLHLNEVQAVAATQAAIWHFSNGATIATDTDKNPADVVALYDYLIGAANTGDIDQPKPSLSIAPAELAGKAGEKIGPFTVDSTATEVALSIAGPTGVALVDKDGKAVTHVKPGTEIFVQVPSDVAPGEVTIKAAATATIEQGRLFVGTGDKRTQTLIVASSKPTRLVSSAKATWAVVAPTTTVPTTTPAPTTTTVPGGVVPTTTSKPPVNSLPNTGASVLPAIGIGAVLVAAGATTLFLRRRRTAA